MSSFENQLYSAEAIKTLERYVIEVLQISSCELMNRAGTEAWQVLTRHWPTCKRLAVFCGGGNNAGDGYVLAWLAKSAGLDVVVYALVTPERLSGDALTMYMRYCQAGGVIEAYSSSSYVQADIIVDALFGTGLNKPVTGLYAEAIQQINTLAVPVLAIDIPSGLHADTGMVLGCAVKAAVTVTFIGIKQGLVTGDAGDYCGQLYCAALSIPDEAFGHIKSTAYQMMQPRSWPKRLRNSHKGHYGHVLVVGGEVGYTGAAKLAGTAALRVGAGLVSIATKTAHAAMLNIGQPELMCHGVDNGLALQKLLENKDVLVFGPGLGRNAWAKELFSAAMSANMPMVVDADGLNLLAELPLNNSQWVLTPHPGEAARLLGCTTKVIQQNRYQAVSALQATYGGVVLLKGFGTLIASEDDIAVVNSGNPGMASGGMGDVLAGVIGGLLAQGLPAWEAAQQGALIHGLAADRTVAEYGERGLLASDLFNYLRRLVN